MLVTDPPQGDPERTAGVASPPVSDHEPLLAHGGAHMAAHFKLHDDDQDFLGVPDGAVMVSSGVSGTETWIERDRDVTVRIVLQTVAVATADDAKLQAFIDIGDGSAKGEDGPSTSESHLKAMQSVQVVVKQGERLSFKAYPQATNAKVLRTVVYTADQK
jgi:hypothetical protein